MNIAISNIAWTPEENEKILSLLEKLTIRGLEIAPTKIWENPLAVRQDQLATFKQNMNAHQLQVIAMQSLLFNHPELQIFVNDTNRVQTLSYLEHVIKVGSGIGAQVLVFGSPKNRTIPFDMAMSDANAIAYDFFTRLGDIAQKYGLVIGIEPNPEKYGTNFLNTSDEVITFVRHLNHPAVKVHLDTGAMYVNKENYTTTIENAIPYLAHFHISHDNLDDITNPGIDHKKIASILRKHGYNRWVSIEMRNKQDNFDRIKKALLLVKKYYV